MLGPCPRAGSRPPHRQEPRRLLHAHAREPPAGPFAGLGAPYVGRTGSTRSSRCSFASGLIPWHEGGGPADPWNHVEARPWRSTPPVITKARPCCVPPFPRARLKRADGSFPASLLPEAASLESRVRHQCRVALPSPPGCSTTACRSRDPSGHCSPVSFGLVEAAIAFVLAHQRDDERDRLVGRGREQMILRCSPRPRRSTSPSRRRAFGLARRLPCVKRRSWAVAREQLRRAVTGGGRALPRQVGIRDGLVLPGPVGRPRAVRRTAAHPRRQAAAFVVPERSALSVRPTLGDDGRNRRVRHGVSPRRGRRLGPDAVFVSVGQAARESGGYLTGLVYPERSEFPAG